MTETSEKTTLIIHPETTSSQNYCAQGFKGVFAVFPYVFSQTKENIKEGFKLSKPEGAFRLAITAVFIGGAWVSSSYLVNIGTIKPTIAHDITLLGCKLVLVPTFALIGSTLGKQVPITKLLEKSCCGLFANKAKNVPESPEVEQENTTELTV